MSAHDPLDGSGSVGARMGTLSMSGMTERDFSLFARLIQDTCGIRMPPAKRTMLEGRLRKRMKALGLTTYREYWSYLEKAPGGGAELVHMIDAVTTNKTDFFREPAHMEYLYREAVPNLLTGAGAGSGRTLRVWSAGCSTGKEAYTLAMVLSEYRRREREIHFSIMGTDISTRSIEKAVRGVYPREKADAVPDGYRRRYLLRSRDREKGLVRIAPEIRSLVTFGRLNFLDEDYGFRTPFDIIFCRNVIIYFDPPNQHRILSRVCRHLVQGGYLFTGHSETLHGMDLPLVPVAPSVYRKKG